MDALPVIYHVHDLETLLFYSGLWKQVQTEPAVWASFSRLAELWSEQLRYDDPAASTAHLCQQVDVWLSDAATGVVPWLRGKL